MKKTLILGASSKPERYSAKALLKLREHGHEVLAVGNREDELDGVKIHKQAIHTENIDTVTLYLNPKRQEQYYDYILSLAPKRILFNPGTENPDLQALATENRIAWEEACTLILLGRDAY